jgi:hypothetical protein
MADSFFFGVCAVLSWQYAGAAINVITTKMISDITGLIMMVR